MELERKSLSDLHADLISDADSSKQFSDLLDGSFSVPQGQHFFDDFPVWDSKFGVAQLIRIGVFQNTKLLSSAAVRLASLKVGMEEIPVAIIGAVATATPWRELGLASNTVGFALEWARENGASMVLLWGSEHKFYEKFGFELHGRQIRVSLVKLLEKFKIKDQDETQNTIHLGWNSKIFEILKKRTDGLVLTEKDRGWYESHKNVAWYTMGDPNNPTAYAALGRGIDLKGLVHEWGGEGQALLKLFRKIESLHPGTELLGSKEGIDRFGFSCDSQIEEHLCLAKLLKPDLLGQNAGVLPSFWVWGLDSA